MPKALKNRASKQNYFSQNQLTLGEFDGPLVGLVDGDNVGEVLGETVGFFVGEV